MISESWLGRVRCIIVMFSVSPHHPLSWTVLARLTETSVDYRSLCGTLLPLVANSRGQDQYNLFKDDS